MVSGAKKSGARRQTQTRTATGVKKRYEERKPSKAHCICGRTLPGTARGPKGAVKKLSKTQRRPSRPFGGVLCSVCSKKLLRSHARLSQD